MREAVVIKSFPNGLKLILNPDMPFENLYVEFAQKLIESERFLGDAKLVLTFEGRKLSDLEERALIEAFGEYTNVTVLCIMDRDEKKNQVFIQAANAFSPSGKTENTSVYKGTLHAGQNLETEGSIAVLGDVNPGASITAAGSVVVLGTVYGDVSAGSKGDEGSFVAALDIKAEAITVCQSACRMFTKNAGFLRKIAGAKIIYFNGEEAVCEDITKEFLADIPF
ncbi:MAG: septum site-determining protein MinC [Lachnospiraceae bacterium]|nr:septum site-determining protein MinC [Lachnospiraceae bacterium]